MKKYWFYLGPYTLLWKKEGKVLLYNTLSGEHILFEPDLATLPIVDAWTEVDNMYGVELIEADVEKTSVQSLIFGIRKK